MDFKYEYLLIIDKKNKLSLFNLCDSNKRFLEILNKEKIQNKSNKLIFNEIEYLYTLQTDIIEEKKERYFHFKVICENEEKLEDYIEFSKELKKIFNNYNFGIEILRDDLPLYYSEEAYILINKLENHMRKFIKYFLITKVGINWIEETTPREIEKVIEDKKDRDKEDKLKRLDFIELGYFLFKKYSKKNISELQKLVNEKKELNQETLKEFIQESNWEKYFKENINCDNDYMNSKWNKLYVYRNNIAHNKDFNYADLEEVKKLCKEVNEKLKEAFNGIDKIKNTDIDKLEVKHVLNSLNDSASIYEKIIASINPSYENETAKAILRLNDSASIYEKIIANNENETAKAILKLNNYKKNK
jgi:hypothetical protein